MASLADLDLVCLAPDTVVPTANGSAARTLGMARLVVPHFRRVSIRCFSSAPAPGAAVDGVTVRHLPRPSGGWQRARYLAEASLAAGLGFRFPELPGEPALLQLESPLLFEAARRAGLRRFVLNAHNVYQDMARFPQASLRDRVFYGLTGGRQARMETACWQAAEHVIFCSTADRERAVSLVPDVARKSSVVPNCVDADRFVARPAETFTARGPVLFIGTTRYPPNFFAVQEICRDIAPRLPWLEFWIVGDPVFAPARVPANVRILGLVAATAAPLAAARVAIAPLRHGSGSRLKILEYLAAGLPVVATATAAAGLEVSDGRDIRLAESSEALVAALAELDANPAACAALGAAGRRLVERRYDWKLWRESLLAIYRGQLGAR